MRDRETIEKDVPKRVDLRDADFHIEIPRNNQTLLTLILEVLLDMREMIQRHKGVSWK